MTHIPSSIISSSWTFLVFWWCLWDRNFRSESSPTRKTQRIKKFHAHHTIYYHDIAIYHIIISIIQLFSFDFLRFPSSPWSTQIIDWQQAKNRTGTNGRVICGIDSSWLLSWVLRHSTWGVFNLALWGSAYLSFPFPLLVLLCSLTSK